jgi:hypothetical protein
VLCTDALDLVCNGTSTESVVAVAAAVCPWVRSWVDPTVTKVSGGHTNQLLRVEPARAVGGVAAHPAVEPAAQNHSGGRGGGVGGSASGGGCCGGGEGQVDGGDGKRNSKGGGGGVGVSNGSDNSGAHSGRDVSSHEVIQNGEPNYSSCTGASLFFYAAGGWPALDPVGGPVLVRLFGAAGMIDRAVENPMFAALSKHLGPPA